MLSYQLMFPGVRSSLVFSGLNLSLLTLVFSLIFRVASRLLHSYSPDNKTSRLMVKNHSKGYPERLIELHGEEKRE